MSLFCSFFITQFLQYSSLLEFYDYWVTRLPKIYNMSPFEPIVQSILVVAVVVVVIVVVVVVMVVVVMVGGIGVDVIEHSLQDRSWEVIINKCQLSNIWFAGNGEGYWYWIIKYHHNCFFVRQASLEIKKGNFKH